MRRFGGTEGGGARELTEGGRREWEAGREGEEEKGGWG